MSDEATPVASLMAPEIVQARDALAASEKTAGNHEWAQQFGERSFDTVEAVHMAYATRGDDPAPDGADDPPEPPELIFGKYKTMEEAEKGFKNLEAKLGAPKEAPKATSDLEIKAEESVETAGLSMDDLQGHYNEHGSLSDDHYSALAKSGLNKAAVDGLIGEIAEARGAKAASATAQIFESVGGEEAYTAMTDWAQGNLSAAEVASYNKVCNSGDLGLIQLATQGLQAKHKAAVGSGGTDGFIAGQSKAPSGISGFESQAEMVAAFGDPRMQTLPSYYAQMQERMKRTTAF